jgi:hypothetical protein
VTGRVEPAGEPRTAKRKLTLTLFISLFSMAFALEEFSMASNDGHYEVLWPRSPRQVQLQPLAKRLDTLEGKTIAQLWDYVFRGDEVYALLEEGLKERFPNIRWVSYKEFGSTHGGEEREIVAALPRRFKELKVDAAISGMGC